MSAVEAVTFRSFTQTILITRGPVPRGGHLRLAGGGEIRLALTAHLSGDAAAVVELAAFWVDSGGRPVSVLLQAELIAEVAAAVDAGRLRGLVLREPAYVSAADHLILMREAEEAVRAGAGAPPRGRSRSGALPADMSVPAKFAAVFQRAVPLVGPEVRRQLARLVEDPANLAIAVGTLVILAQLHAVAAGEVIDGVVLSAIVACAVLEGVGVYQALVSAMEAVIHLVEFVIATVAAKEERDLDKAAKSLAAGISSVGVSVLMAALARISGRFSDSVKKAGGKRTVQKATKEEMAGKGAKALPQETSSGGRAANLPAKVETNHPLGRLLSSHSAVEPGPLSDNLAATFSGGRYKVVALDRDLELFRAGDGRQPLGQFFSRDMPSGIAQVRIDKAILSEWPGGAKSPVNSVVKIKIPAGTKIYVGEVSSQGGFYVGGTEQIVVPEPWKINGIQITPMGSLK